MALRTSNREHVPRRKTVKSLYMGAGHLAGERTSVQHRIKLLRQRSAPQIAESLAHRATIRTPIDEIARTLQSLLTRQLTAFIVGVKDPKSITRWASRQNETIREPDVERRLLATYQIASMLLEVDSPSTVKAWFVGMNPALADLSPAEVIRMGREADALDAAKEFIANG